MQLLLRFYDPTEGLITVDGVDIRQYNIKHLRSAIALVSQEPVLFSGTVRNNVDFGLGRPDEEIRAALMHASIPKFAEELDRDVGTHGSAISGGQKQRLAIARAILRNPRILLLDEATSALDSRTEKKILGALEFAGRGRSVLVIAHRLSTIQHCDEILVMDAGQIKERGSHEQLLSVEGGIYRRLLAQA
jgi:ABC-type multidrug transport system fused ATPase/permease subunit